MNLSRSFVSRLGAVAAAVVVCAATTVGAPVVSTISAVIKRGIFTVATSEAFGSINVRAKPTDTYVDIALDGSDSIPDESFPLLHWYWYVDGALFDAEAPSPTVRICLTESNTYTVTLVVRDGLPNTSGPAVLTVNVVR